MRFKFTCSCGKKLAAYSWMVGRITECPKCHTTMTVPTPERAAELLGSRADDTTRYHSKSPAHPRRRLSDKLLITLVILLTLAVAAVYVYLFLWPKVL